MFLGFVSVRFRHRALIWRSGADSLLLLENFGRRVSESVLGSYCEISSLCSPLHANLVVFQSSQDFVRSDGLGRAKVTSGGQRSVINLTCLGSVYIMRRLTLVLCSRFAIQNSLFLQSQVGPSPDMKLNSMVRSEPRGFLAL